MRGRTVFVKAWASCGERVLRGGAGGIGGERDAQNRRRDERMCSKTHGHPPENVFEKAQVKSYYKSPRRTAPFAQPQEAGMDPLKSIGSIDPARRALSVLDEFKNFALKGNVVDLAVGVIIGAAFAKIVDSLVKHILMPFVGILAPG